MEFKKYSPETIAELLIYIADHEQLACVDSLNSFTKAEVRHVMHELANNLKEIAGAHPITRRETVKSDLTDNVFKVISKLSPQEENLLFKSFKIS
ncbi:MAG: hypothetical protein ABII18_07715 [bacterium]|nr:hypothetical protein [bacterium]MBU1918006.1 hypothetical protein [bacterium]